MVLVFDYVLLLVSALVSSALKFVSQTIRYSSAIHKLVKMLDRGKSKVSGLIARLCTNQHVPHVVHTLLLFGIRARARVS